MKCMAIHSWARVFEPSMLKDAMGTVSLPMKRGTGISKLAKIDGGAAAYGIFITLLPIAMACVPRGTLIYTDKAGVRAHDADSLALVTGFPLDVITSALALLIDIGWLEEVEFSDVPAASTATKARLADILEECGAKLSFKGEALLDEWSKAVKGLNPEMVKKVFKQAKPGISYPREFVRQRAAMGL